MTTPQIVQVQVSFTETLGMVAEQGSLGLMFRNIPIVNDDLVSNANPLPVTDPITEAAMAAISANIDAITAQVNAGTTSLAALFTQLATALAALGSGTTPPTSNPMFEQQAGNTSMIDGYYSPPTDFIAGSAITTGYNEVCVVLILNITGNTTGPSVNVQSVTDTTGLTWTQRSQINFFTSGPAETGAQSLADLEVWWAYAATPINSLVTIDFNAIPDAASVISFSVRYLSNPVSPWDTNGSIPAAATGGFDLPVNAVPNITTTSTHPLLLGYGASASLNADPATTWIQEFFEPGLQGQGYSGQNSSISESGNFGVGLVLVSQQQTAALNNATVTPFVAGDAFTASGGNNIVMVDAFACNSAPNIPPAPGWSMMGTASALPSVVNSANINITTVINNGSLIILFVSSYVNNLDIQPSVTSITDNIGLTWTRRGVTFWGNFVSTSAEIWYAVSTGANDYTITLNFSTTIESSVIVASEFAGQNVSLSAPWDTNSSLPGFNSAGLSEVISVSNISTTSTSPLIIAFAAATIQSGDSTDVAQGWTTPVSISNTAETNGVYTVITTLPSGVALNNMTVGPFNTLSLDDDAIIIDALAYSP